MHSIYTRIVTKSFLKRGADKGIIINVIEFEFFNLKFMISESAKKREFYE